MEQNEFRAGHACGLVAYCVASDLVRVVLCCFVGVGGDDEAELPCCCCQVRRGVVVTDWSILPSFTFRLPSVLDSERMSSRHLRKLRPLCVCVLGKERREMDVDVAG